MGTTVIVIVIVVVIVIVTVIVTVIVIVIVIVIVTVVVIVMVIVTVRRLAPSSWPSLTIDLSVCPSSLLEVRHHGTYILTPILKHYMCIHE